MVIDESTLLTKHDVQSPAMNGSMLMNFDPSKSMSADEFSARRQTIRK